MSKKTMRITAALLIITASFFIKYTLMEFDRGLGGFASGFLLSFGVVLLLQPYLKRLFGEKEEKPR